MHSKSIILEQNRWYILHSTYYESIAGHLHPTPYFILRLRLPDEPADVMKLWSLDIVAKDIIDTLERSFSNATELASNLKEYYLPHRLPPAPIKTQSLRALLEDAAAGGSISIWEADTDMIDLIEKAEVLHAL